MISQNCPRCHSSRVRQGYRETPFWWKIFGRYNLLCNNCNWEFIGFAVPGTVTTRPRHRRNRQDADERDDATTQPAESTRRKVKKRVRVKTSEQQ